MTGCVMLFYAFYVFYAFGRTTESRIVLPDELAKIFIEEQKDLVI